MSNQRDMGGDVPIVLALSNPTDKAECTAEEAFQACHDRVAFGSGTAFQPFTASDGREVVPSQANNSFIFPGEASGAILHASSADKSALCVPNVYACWWVLTRL